MLIQTKGIDAERISFKDYKGKFNILADGKSRNVICSLFFTSSTKKISIDEVTYDLNAIEDIVDYKKQLLNSAKDRMDV